MKDPIVIIFDGEPVDILRLTSKFIWDHRRKIFNRLAKLCRWGGECPEFYSIAEHSVLVADIVRQMGGSPSAQLHALLHDAHEAFTGDVIDPLRKKLPALIDLQEGIDLVLLPALGVPHPEENAATVNIADKNAKALEINEFDFPMIYPAPKIHLSIHYLPWKASSRLMAQEFDYLFRKSYAAREKKNQHVQS